jgi:hypothetical protein
MIPKYNKNHNALFMFINRFPKNNPIGTKYCYYSIHINIRNAWKTHLQQQYSILPSLSFEG